MLISLWSPTSMVTLCLTFGALASSLPTVSHRSMLSLLRRRTWPPRRLLNRHSCFPSLSTGLSCIAVLWTGTNNVELNRARSDNLLLTVQTQLTLPREGNLSSAGGTRGTHTARRASRELPRPVAGCIQGSRDRGPVDVDVTLDALPWCRTMPGLYY